MVNFRNFRLHALSLALLAAPPAWAIGFGDIILHSRIGEPLRAEVPINAAAGEAVAETCFSLAQLSGSDLPVIANARTKLMQDGSGYRLLITGSKPVSEPIFLIGLRAGCGVDLQRDFVLMPNEPLILASPGQVSDSTGDTRSSGAAIRELRANEGDTLESIAEKQIPGNLVQQRRMLAALKRANPELSRKPALAAGTTVVIPELKQRVATERDALPQQQARARSEPPPPPPPPPPKVRAKVAKPATKVKAPPADRVLIGAPPAEIEPGNSVAPPKGSRAELDERMLKVEATIASLNTQIEALDKALALTTEAIALQQKLQAAQAATGSVPPPLPKPPAPPPEERDNIWLQILLTALGGGLIAAGIAHLLGRRHERLANDEPPLPMRKTPPQPVPPEPQPAAAAGIDIRPDDFSKTPEEAKAVDVRFDQDDNALALAEIMLSFGRTKDAADALARHIEESSPKNPRPWLMLLDLYRRTGMRDEYGGLLPAVRGKFNLDVPAWQDLETAVSGLRSLEEFAHVAERVQAAWGTQAAMDYLDALVHDNRDGQRNGFPLEVVEEIVLLMLILEDAYGLQHAS